MTPPRVVLTTDDAGYVRSMSILSNLDLTNVVELPSGLVKAVFRTSRQADRAREVLNLP